MNRLKDMREDNEKDQKTIAKLLGISQQYYSRYELGQIEMPIRHYIKLAKLYDVSIDYLCGAINTPRIFDTTKKELTTKQLALIQKYEKNKELQKAVDKLLDLN